jgi:hypothetical protein
LTAPRPSQGPCMVQYTSQQPPSNEPIVVNIHQIPRGCRAEVDALKMNQSRAGAKIPVRSALSCGERWISNAVNAASSCAGRRGPTIAAFIWG